MKGSSANDHFDIIGRKQIDVTKLYQIIDDSCNDLQHYYCDLEVL